MLIKYYKVAPWVYYCQSNCQATIKAKRSTQSIAICSLSACSQRQLYYLFIWRP